MSQSNQGLKLLSQDIQAIQQTQSGTQEKVATQFLETIRKTEALTLPSPNDEKEREV
jgi:hypothetical protein